ncbi:MAG: DUF4397 domain-containing protein [Acidimicrobiales bacterium]
MKVLRTTSGSPPRPGPASSSRRRSPLAFGWRPLLALVALAPLLGLQGAPASAQGGAAPGGWARFAYFVAGGPVRVLLDGKLLATGVAFEDVTPYQPVASGPHTIAVAEIAAPHTTLSTGVVVAPGAALTVGAVPGSHGPRLRSFVDDLAVGPAGEERVRVINAAPSAASLQVFLQRTGPAPGASSAAPRNGPSHLATPVVPFDAASTYADIPSATYTVTVRGPKGQALVMGKNWPAVAGAVASIVVVQSQGRVTLDVLRDATGASTTPVGGMQTGYGGAAALLAGPPRPVPAPITGLGLAVSAALAVIFGLAWRARRRVLRRRHSSRRPVFSTVVAGSALVLVPIAPVAIALGAGAPALTAPRAVAVGPTRTGPTRTGPTRTGPARTGPISPTSSGVARGPVGGPMGKAESPEAPSPSPSPSPSAQPLVAPAPTTDVARSATTIDLARSAGTVKAVAPSWLAIPAIGLRTSLVRLGLAADGAVEVLSSTTVAGWFSGSPAPGQPGPSVILGHVDSDVGPAVFFGLHELNRGALVEVKEGGSVVAFVVQTVGTYGKTDFPTAAVFGPTPLPTLRLVTCGGPFDYATGHYEDNVVVFATEVELRAGTAQPVM